jgi:TonB family protein
MLHFRFAISLLSSMLLFASTGAYQTQAPDPQSSPSPTTPAYPESSEGLKNLVRDIFAAINAEQQEKVSGFAANLAIPDHSAWFARVFGAEEGARIDARYQKLLPKLDDNLRNAFSYAKKMGAAEFRVQEYRKGAEAEPRGLDPVVVNAMQDSVTLYSVDGFTREKRYPFYLGEFFYVAGGFRYVSSDVLRGLSSAPPMRVRIGGNVQQSKLVYKVDPTYPLEAVRSHTEGTVVLHVVIGVDGSMKEVQLVSGDSTLSAAAIEAVRQWRYQPTLLNGEPVEVDSTISVIFTLTRSLNKSSASFQR